MKLYYTVGEMKKLFDASPFEYKKDLVFYISDDWKGVPTKCMGCEVEVRKDMEAYTMILSKRIQE